MTIFYTGKLTPDSNNSTEEIIIPTNISAFTNDAGYLTSHQDISGKQDVLTAGDNITIENNIISATGQAANTPYFSINNGNKNISGSADILSYSGSTLSFKVDDGTSYKPLTITTGSGEQIEKNALSTVDVSSLSNGTYNLFIPKAGNQPYLLNNRIFVQAEKPADVPTDTIPNMTSNTTPYGIVESSDTVVKAYDVFNSASDYAYIANPNYQYNITGSITYIYDNNKRLTPGTYNVGYTSKSGNIRIDTVKFYYSDDTTLTITRNNKASFTDTVNLTDSVYKVVISCTNTSNNTAGIGKLKIQKPAILDQGTLWVNNKVEPLEVNARDSEGQWQPFNDVLCGSVTVSSGMVTSVVQPEFNKFSPVNMHNISSVAHEDIRYDINTINNILNDKANTSSLAAVATSGSYVDLTNTPTIPNVTSIFNPQGTDAVNGIAVANAVGAISNTIAGGTVYEGKFSELPAFISGLSGKLSNGTVTYKITQDETIDENTSTLTMEILLMTIPKWNIPEVIIDGNEKTITLETGVLFISPDYDFVNNKFLTGFNNITQTLTFKNLNISINAESDVDVTNMANINLKLDSCTITSVSKDASVTSGAGYLEAYYCEFESMYSGDKKPKGIQIFSSGKCLTLANTFKDHPVAIEVSEGGQIQSIEDIYDNCVNAIEVRKSGTGTLYTESTTTGSKVVNSNTNTLGGIVYN